MIGFYPKRRGWRTPVWEIRPRIMMDWHWMEREKLRRYITKMLNNDTSYDWTKKISMEKNLDKKQNDK